MNGCIIVYKSALVWTKPATDTKLLCIVYSIFWHIFVTEQKESIQINPCNANKPTHKNQNLKNVLIHY